jgi:hypothetical protein
MDLECGIVGLHQVGKSPPFDARTKAIFRGHAASVHRLRCFTAARIRCSLQLASIFQG